MSITPRSRFREALESGRTGRTPWLLTILALAPGVLALLGPLVAIAIGSDAVSSVGRPWSDTGLLGLDILGRSVAARLLVGGATLVFTAVMATLLTEVLALAAASAIAWWPRWRPAARWVTDLVLTVPGIVVVLTVVTAWGVSPLPLMVIVILLTVPFSVRFLGASLTPLLRRGHVETARAAGDGFWRVIIHEVLPGLIRHVVADAAMRYVFSIYVVATASFLGASTSATTVTWAADVQRNLTALAVNPAASLAPLAGVIALTVPVTLVADRWAKEVA